MTETSDMSVGAEPEPAAARASRTRELGRLLRSRRERLRPADVGLPEGARRRTRGLRREEVALLAGVSSTYYTFLEQGRAVRPSPQVLDALARALQLSAPERVHLYLLAHNRPPADDDAPAEALAPEVAALVDRLDPYPTYVKGRRYDVLAANRAARVLFTDWPARPPDDRNLVWWVFTDPAAREVYVEWKVEAAALLARFRLAAARRADDPEFVALIDRLHDASPEVRTWWPRHEVAPPGSGTKVLHHPATGPVAFQHVVLEVTDQPGLRVVTFSPADADRSAAVLAALDGAGQDAERGP